MALSAILTIAGTAGFVAAEIQPVSNGSNSTAVIVGGVVAVVVAVIGGGVQVWVSRRNKTGPDSELTVSARVAVLEMNQADMKRDLEELLNHVRPWPEERRHR